MDPPPTPSRIRDWPPPSPSSPASPASARTSSQFGYQTKLLERSSSRASTLSLHKPTHSVPNGPASAGALGSVSGSVRRAYPRPLSHRPTSSLDASKYSFATGGIGAGDRSNGAAPGIRSPGSAGIYTGGHANGARSGPSSPSFSLSSSPPRDWGARAGAELRHDAGPAHTPGTPGTPGTPAFTPVTPVTPVTPITPTRTRRSRTFGQPSDAFNAAVLGPAGDALSAAIPDGTPSSVQGMHGRVRLSRQGAPTAATSSVTSSLPFSSSSRWMDKQRHLLQAYEYLCHVGEAKQWMELCLKEEIGAGVVEMEESMRDGVALAKLAREFEPDCVPRIFVHPKLQFRHSDNINYFFIFIVKVGLPEFFRFELTDLYEKKNFPKVIYCIHALSHLMARRGLTERIGNLLGKLEFSDDQLQATQRGLDASGVAMPNFGGVGRALAKEINEEPEPEPEPEESEEERRAMMEEWATTLQAAARGSLQRRAWRELARGVRESASVATKVQAQARGCLARRRYERLHAHLGACERSVVSVQSLARAVLARRAHHGALKQLEEVSSNDGLVELQSRIRGALQRRRFFAPINALDEHESSVAVFQAHVRGYLARMAYQDLLFELADCTESVIRTQAVLRTALVKRRLLSRIRGLQSSAPSIAALQAHMRGALVRRRFMALRGSLAKAEVSRSVGGLQAFAKAALTRRRHMEQKKQLDFVVPDVVGLQTACRAYLARRDFDQWRQHLEDSQSEATFLQALVRGFLGRRRFRQKMAHYRHNLDKVVKVQSIFRARQQGEQYRRLAMGKNVPVSTIKNFGHLLNDSDHDFEDEIEVERLRKLVVQSIRQNQVLDSEREDLDVKIALLVKNKIGIEELVKAKKAKGLIGSIGDTGAQFQRRNSVLAAAGDPFSDQTLDRATKRKLELYQELFYVLQTRPDYLARLFSRIARIDMSEKQTKTVERITLTLFGYAQKAREEFLLLKVFQRSIQEELSHVQTIQEFVKGNAQYIKLVVQYNRGAKERKYLRELLGPLVKEVMEDDKLDLETDPCTIYRSTINDEERSTGRPSRRPLQVNFTEALADPQARTLFIRHLQHLRAATEMFLNAILASTKKMPYGIRYIAREVFRALQVKFPNEPEDALFKVVGHLVYYRYLNPAIVAPEGFDVIENIVGPMQRKNLAEVSKMLTQISVGKLFNDENPYLQPLNEYVGQASQKFSNWLRLVIDVVEAEQQFAVDEFIDHNMVEKPVIYISPNEIYSLHSLLLEQLGHLAPNKDDPLRVILLELGGAPVSGSSELNNARSGEITLELANRLTNLNGPEAEIKALWVETKRLILSVLKVQTGPSLMDVLIQPVTEEEEVIWEEVVSLELAADQEQRKRTKSELPPLPVAGEPVHLEDVRRLPFVRIKEHLLENMLQLERLGKVSRENHFQDVLDAIAVDIRNKHRKRIQRQTEKASMNATLVNLAEKKAYLDEQISTYHGYIDQAMLTMQKKGSKKRFVLPFTQQYFHLRELKASGKVPQFGSYKYTAERLYKEGVLLSIDQVSPRQFDKLTLTISSDEAGLFTIETSFAGLAGEMMDLRIEDLLEAQFNNVQSMSLFDGAAKVNLNLLIHLINRKFYA